MENDVLIGYKIVEIKKGQIRTLFHGIKRDKRIKLDQWNKAEKKMVKDGSKSRYYLSGWHFLKSKEECQNVLDEIFRIKENRKIVKCFFRGDIRKKHIDGRGRQYFLADEIYISSKDH